MIGIMLRLGIVAVVMLCVAYMNIDEQAAADAMTPEQINAAISKGDAII